MTLKQLIANLREINKYHGHDREACHIYMDNVLLKFIDNKIVTKEFVANEKRYT